MTPKDDVPAGEREQQGAEFRRLVHEVCIDYAAEDDESIFRHGRSLDALHRFWQASRASPVAPVAEQAVAETFPFPHERGGHTQTVWVFDAGDIPPSTKLYLAPTSTASMEAAEPDHDCGYRRGSILCRVCDQRQSDASPPREAPTGPDAIGKIDLSNAVSSVVLNQHAREAPADDAVTLPPLPSRLAHTLGEAPTEWSVAIDEARRAAVLADRQSRVPDGWISVEDRLPSDKAEYVHNLLVVNAYGSRDVATYDGYAKYFEMGSTSKLGGHPVTHWMPLPVAPKGPSE